MSEDAFARHRSLLFTVAYEMLGSASDAEDVVQETWLRWADVDHAAVRNPRSRTPFPSRRIPEAVDALLRTDLALKSSGGDPQVLLERLVVELCG